VTAGGTQISVCPTILAKELRSYLSFYGLLTRYRDSDESPSDPRATAPYNPRGSTADLLGTLLKTLWTDLVEPILQALAIRVCQNFTIDVFKLMLGSLRFQSMVVTTCLVFGGAQQVLSLFFPYTRQEYMSKTRQPNAWLISLYLRTFRR
jgi:hypothetical protein